MALVVLRRPLLPTAQTARQDDARRAVWAVGANNPIKLPEEYLLLSQGLAEAEGSSGGLGSSSKREYFRVPYPPCGPQTPHPNWGIAPVWLESGALLPGGVCWRRAGRIVSGSW